MTHNWSLWWWLQAGTTHVNGTMTDCTIPSLPAPWAVWSDFGGQWQYHDWLSQPQTMTHHGPMSQTNNVTPHQHVNTQSTLHRNEFRLTPKAKRRRYAPNLVTTSPNPDPDFRLSMIFVLVSLICKLVKKHRQPKIRVWIWTFGPPQTQKTKMRISTQICDLGVLSPEKFFRDVEIRLSAHTCRGRCALQGSTFGGSKIRVQGEDAGAARKGTREQNFH